MRVKLQTFAGLKDRLGWSEIWIEDLREGAKVEDLLAMLARRWPFVDRYPLAVALNRRLVERQHALADGDEVALLPPVSGG